MKNSGDVLDHMYSVERAEIISDILMIAYGEGIFSALSTGVSAVKNAGQSVRREGNKVGGSRMAQEFKTLTQKFFQMLSNLARTMINGEKKLKNLHRDIQNTLPKRAPNQNTDKLPATIKSCTEDDIGKMLGDSGKGEFDTIMNMLRRNIKESGERDDNWVRFDFSDKEKAQKTLNEIAQQMEENIKVFGITTPFKKRLSSYTDVTPDEFGAGVKVIYSATPLDKQGDPIVKVQYFKNPVLSEIPTENNNAFTVLSKNITSLDEQTIEPLLAMNFMRYLNKVEQNMKQAQRDLDKLNVNNVDGSENIKNTNSNISKSDETADGQSFNYEMSLIMDEIRSFAEDSTILGGQTGQTSTPAKSQDSQTEVINNKGTTTDDNGNLSQDKDLAKKNADRNSAKIGDDASEIAEEYKYIKAFLVNYAIAINQLANRYNSYCVNIFTAGRRMLNDFYSITIDSK